MSFLYGNGFTLDIAIGTNFILRACTNIIGYWLFQSISHSAFYSSHRLASQCRLTAKTWRYPKHDAIYGSRFWRAAPWILKQKHFRTIRPVCWRNDDLAGPTSQPTRKKTSHLGVKSTTDPNLAAQIDDHCFLCVSEWWTDGRWNWLWRRRAPTFRWLWVEVFHFSLRNTVSCCDAKWHHRDAKRWQIYRKNSVTHVSRSLNRQVPLSDVMLSGGDCISNFANRQP